MEASVRETITFAVMAPLASSVTQVYCAFPSKVTPVPDSVIFVPCGTGIPPCVSVKVISVSLCCDRLPGSAVSAYFPGVTVKDCVSVCPSVSMQIV